MPKELPPAKDIIAAYTAAPDQFEAAVDDLVESDMNYSLSEDTWSIRELVHHIVDGDDLTKMIVKAAIGKPGCVYDQRWYDTTNSWARTHDYKRRLVGPGLELFRANHLHLDQLLSRIPEAPERIVLLKWESKPGGHTFTVAELLHTQNHHFQHHLDQIKKIREKHGV